jgi:putative transposase
LEYKAVGKPEQYRLINEAVRTAQFVQNKCLRLWKDGEKVGKYDISKYTTSLRQEFEWCGKLNSTAVQAAGERAWSAISRFYENVKKGLKPVQVNATGRRASARNLGYPRFKKNCRSVEYKHSGWKLDGLSKRITFTDGFGIGTLKLKGTYDLALYPLNLIKRVRLLKRSDGYYVQFAISVDRSEEREPTGKAIGLDVGLESFYTDSEGKKAENPRFLRKAEKRLKLLGRRSSRKKKGSNNRKKANNRLARKHLKVSRQRKAHAIEKARDVMMSNDFVAYEDLRIANMVKSRSLAKSINDASWYQFRVWLEYYGKVLGKATVAVAPQWTSQNCSNCGERVQKALSNRTHSCPKCGSLARQGRDRDENAARPWFPRIAKRFEYGRAYRNLG